ncbi:MAG: hypothetical protein KGM42_09815 [Hyphomicrobiales bacterium]|nr:hypothetical protein [Hyphomicrobiales bacterium]
MSVRFQIAAMLFLVALSVLFGVGLVIVLTTPLAARAMQLTPWVAVVSAFLSGPIAWSIAPRLRARYRRRKVVAAVWRGERARRDQNL